MHTRIDPRGFTALSLSIALASCRAADSRSGTGATRAPSAAANAAAAAHAGASDASNSVASLASADVHAVCDSVFAEWHSNPHVRVASIDTTVQPMRDDGSVGPTEPACVVSAVLDSAAEADTSRSGKGYWGNAHWMVLPHLGADGPGSAMMAMQRALVRCEVTHISDASDDDDPVDSTKKATPARPVVAVGEIEGTLCYRAAPVTARDTSIDAAPPRDPSYRNASAGSTRDVRSAGTHDGIMAIRAMTAATRTAFQRFYV